MSKPYDSCDSCCCVKTLYDCLFLLPAMGETWFSRVHMKPYVYPKVVLITCSMLYPQ